MSNKFFDWFKTNKTNNSHDPSIELFRHNLSIAAFDNQNLAYKYKIAADNALPWNHGFHGSNSLTLWGHTIKEGMAQGYNGFMGYPALSLLDQNGLIRACIGTTADEMTREWINLKQDDSDSEKQGDTDKLKILEDAIAKHDLQRLCNNTIWYKQLFGGLHIYIDTGASDEELITPLPIRDDSLELKNFKRFTIIEPINTFPSYYETSNPLDPNYFVPQIWWVLGKRIHISRLIHIKDDNLPVLLRPAYNFNGVPHAQILWDYVIHYQKLRLAQSNWVAANSRTILKTGMEELLTSEAGQQAIKNRLVSLSDTNNEAMTAIDMNSEDIVQLNRPLSGLAENVWQSLEMLVVANMSPAVKTLGVSPSGFSTGETDIKNWESRIKSLQERDLRTPIEQMLKILQIRYLGAVDSDISFEFNSISEENLEKKAIINKTLVSTIAEAYNTGLVTGEEGRKILAGEPESFFSDIDPELDEDLLPAPNDNFGEENINETRTNVDF